MPTLHYKNKRTPKIKELSDERYVKVNSIINLGGEFYTDVYGNLQGVNSAPVNSDEEIDIDNELVGIFVGPKECEMVSLLVSRQYF